MVRGAVMAPDRAYLSGMDGLTDPAERHVLGALLTSSLSRAAVFAVVRPDDLSDPWHRALYTVLIEHPSVDLPRVGWELRGRLGPGRADLPRLHALIRDLPLSIDAPAWAQLVVEGSLRAEVAQAAVLVEACRLVEPDRSQVREVTATVRDRMTSVETRFTNIVEGRPGTVPQASEPAGDRERQLLGADRLLADVTPPDPAEACDLEVRFIGSLFSHQPRILPWAGHIRPEWLTGREWAPVLSALQRRAELGEPLDVVSVCWEAQRTARAGGPARGSTR